MFVSWTLKYYSVTVDLIQYEVLRNYFVQIKPYGIEINWKKWCSKCWMEPWGGFFVIINAKKWCLKLQKCNFKIFKCNAKYAFDNIWATHIFSKEDFSLFHQFWIIYQGQLGQRIYAFGPFEDRPSMDRLCFWWIMFIGPAHLETFKFTYWFVSLYSI